MPQFTDNVTIRAGATPQTFDGNQTFRFNGEARRVTGISLSHSLSVSTAAEGFAMAIRLSENAGLGSKNPVFFMGAVQMTNVETNISAAYYQVDYMPLNIPVSPNSTMRIDLTTVAGATQTGTHDCSITVHYDSGDTPVEILQAAAAAKGLVWDIKGGSYGYTTALATTTETALTGNGSTLNVSGAREIVGITVLQVLDTALTQSEEIGGKVRLEISGVSNIGKQEYPSNGGRPGLGTEVDSGDTNLIRFLPMYIPVNSSNELQVSGFVSALSAISGGADWAINILWR